MQTLEQTVIDIQKRFDFVPNMEASLAQQDQHLKTIIDQEIKNLDRTKQQRVLSEFLGWGPIEKIIEKPNIFEIMITRSDSIWFEDSDGIHQLEDQFLTPQTYRNFFQRLCQKAKIITSAQTPYGDGDFGLFRVHIITPPLTQTPTITLRKHREHFWSLSELEEMGTLSSLQKQQLEKLLQKKNNFLIVGPTGTGKTTLLTGLLKELPSNERLVIIEDTSEIQCPNPLSVKLLTRHAPTAQLETIDQQTLVKQSLRMRPDRIVMGEIRDIEAKDFLQALATGHQGSIGTLHASSAKQALIRLEMLIQMGAPQWNLQAIRQLIHLSLSHIIVLGHEKAKKKVEGIYHIRSLEKFGFLIEEMKT